MERSAHPGLRVARHRSAAGAARRPRWGFIVNFTFLRSAKPQLGRDQNQAQIQRIFFKITNPKSAISNGAQRPPWTARGSTPLRGRVGSTTAAGFHRQFYIPQERQAPAWQHQQAPKNEATHSGQYVLTPPPPLSSRKRLAVSPRLHQPDIFPLVSFSSFLHQILQWALHPGAPDFFSQVGVDLCRRHIIVTQ